MAITPEDALSAATDEVKELVDRAEPEIDKTLRKHFNSPGATVKVERTTVDFNKEGVVEELRRRYRGWKVDIFYPHQMSGEDPHLTFKKAKKGRLG